MQLCCVTSNKHNWTGGDVSGDSLQYKLEDSELTTCEWRSTVSSHVNTLSLASRGPSADVSRL